MVNSPIQRHALDNSTNNNIGLDRRQHSTRTRSITNILTSGLERTGGTHGSGTSTGTGNAKVPPG
jgi:hypothetical protein